MTPDGKSVYFKWMKGEEIVLLDPSKPLRDAVQVYRIAGEVVQFRIAGGYLFVLERSSNNEYELTSRHLSDNSTVLRIRKICTHITQIGNTRIRYDYNDFDISSNREIVAFTATSTSVAPTSLRTGVSKFPLQNILEVQNLENLKQQRNPSQLKQLPPNSLDMMNTMACCDVSSKGSIHTMQIIQREKNKKLSYYVYCSLIDPIKLSLYKLSTIGGKVKLQNIYEYDHKSSRVHSFIHTLYQSTMHILLDHISLTICIK